jgi:hypothetical protein
MAISAADLATVRRRSGDSNQPYDLTDAEVNLVYLDTDLGNEDLNRTIFYVLWERVGIATNAVAISNPIGGITRNQKFEQIWRLLQKYSAITGIALTTDLVGEGGFAEWGEWDV